MTDFIIVGYIFATVMRFDYERHRSEVKCVNRLCEIKRPHCQWGNDIDASKFIDVSFSFLSFDRLVKRRRSSSTRRKSFLDDVRRCAGHIEVKLANGPLSFSFVSRLVDGWTKFLHRPSKFVVGFGF